MNGKRLSGGREGLSGARAHTLFHPWVIYKGDLNWPPSTLLRGIGKGIRGTDSRP